MRKLLLATENPGKILELRLLLKGVVDEIVTASELEGFPAVLEDGCTFAENAEKKARSAMIFSGIPALADDSGLMVDALGGRPGVLSARFAGDSATDADNNRRLMDEMLLVPPEKRTASFHCVVAICMVDGSCAKFTGEVCGEILSEPRGVDGFGYDPYFYIPDHGMTFAELPLVIKNQISHRGRAFELARNYLLSGFLDANCAEKSCAK